MTRSSATAATADRRSATGSRCSARCRAGRRRCSPTSPWRSGSSAAGRSGCIRDPADLVHAEQGADRGRPPARDQGRAERRRSRGLRAEPRRAHGPEGRRHHPPLSPRRQSVPDPPGVPGPLPHLILSQSNLLKEERVATFTIATPAGPSYGVAGAAYDLEREGMGSLDAEILEIPAGTEDEFIKAARNADALYAKGRPI